MPAISASAPGKVILFGEHAVVYGQPAIAVPVFQVKARAMVLPEPLKPAGWVRLQAPDIGLEALLSELGEEDPLGEAVRQVINKTGVDPLPALTLRVTSTIPVASGLGSGAAVSVAVIRALAEFLGYRLPDRRVAEMAFEVEKIHHGTPSGIDNSVITYARPIYFQRDLYGGKNRLETLVPDKPFTLVIGDSGIPSPTGKVVGDVRQAWRADPEGYEQIFSQIGELVRIARRFIETDDPQALGSLMLQNHDLLVKMGVSCQELNGLVDAAMQSGAWGAKLSGGGRGGNMIALVPPERAKTLADALVKAGAVKTIITHVEVNASSEDTQDR